MTNDELRKWIAEVQQRCDAATEGPWRAGRWGLEQDSIPDDEDEDFEVALARARRDNEFIANSRTDLPTALSHLRDLLARAEAAEAERDRLREELALAYECIGGRVVEAFDRTELNKLRAFRDWAVKAMKCACDDLHEGIMTDLFSGAGDVLVESTKKRLRAALTLAEESP